MKRSFLLSLAILPLIAGCGSVSVGVGVGGASGGLGAGVGVSTDVGGGARTSSGVVVVPMFKITSKGVGEEIGTLMLMDSRGGLRIEPAVGSLPPGAEMTLLCASRMTAKPDGLFGSLLATGSVDQQTPE